MATQKVISSLLDNPGRKNHVINGGMEVAQRGTSFTSGSNNDDAYTLDRFYILSDGNDIIDVTQTTTVPSTALNSIGLDVETTNKKFGIAQIVENNNCTGLIGNTVTLSFEAKVSATTKLDNVKAAIVSWSGTADSVTSDIISAWGDEGTNPTLITNATYENTPANLSVTTSFAKYSVTGTVDTSGANNIIVFIWSDVTDTTAGDFLYITNVQLEVGSSASDFEYLDITDQKLKCYRYYYQSDGSSAEFKIHGTGTVFQSGKCDIYFDLPTQTRSTPTVGQSNTTIQVGASGFPLTGISEVSGGDGGLDRLFLRCDVTGSMTVGQCGILTNNNNAAGKITVSSEL